MTNLESGQGKAIVANSRLVVDTQDYHVVLVSSAPAIPVKVQIS